MIDIKELQVGSVVKHTITGRNYEVIAVGKTQAYETNKFFRIKIDFGGWHMVEYDNFADFEVVSHPDNIKISLLLTQENYKEFLKFFEVSDNKIIVLANDSDKQIDIVDWTATEDKNK